MGARDAYKQRFYPEIDDNNWNDQSHDIASQTNFADYSMAQEEAEGNETACPLFTWTWSDAHGGPTPYLQSPAARARQFFRGSYDPDCVWNLADNVITSRGEASLFTIMDIANALRCMNGRTRTDSCSRCPGSYQSLDCWKRDARDSSLDSSLHSAKKKYRKEREEMRLELIAAQAGIAKAASTLESVRQQYGEQQQELHDDKITALGVLLGEERTATRELRQNLKKAEASIAYLNTKLSVIESGSRDKDAVRNDLQLKLTAVAAAEATSAMK